ncbi:GntR family transcriptional regulator [Streptomyces sp. NPDC056084]|uniref:GIY-YIG nuclease family protein n=1 Tax=unclassified Streptomyces TaxID=2593676 RepID=UPI0035D9EAE0
MSPSIPERTALYRYFDANDQLLYIGISFDPDVRWEGHRGWARWADAAAERTVEWFATRSEALAAETKAIRAERPLCNRAHNYDFTPETHRTWPSLREVKRGKAAKLTELIRAEIAEGRWLPGQRIPSREDVATTTEVSFATAATAFRRLMVSNEIVSRISVGYFVARCRQEPFESPPRDRAVAPADLD